MAKQDTQAETIKIEEPAAVAEYDALEVLDMVPEDLLAVLDEETIEKPADGVSIKSSKSTAYVCSLEA